MRLVRVHTAQTLPEAAVLASMLAARDIDAVMVGWHISSNWWQFLIGLGGVPLLVREQDAADAVHFIRSPVASPELLESRAFRAHALVNVIMTLLLIFGFGIYLPYWVRRAKIADHQPSGASACSTISDPDDPDVSAAHFCHPGRSESAASARAKRRDPGQRVAPVVLGPGSPTAAGMTVHALAIWRAGGSNRVIRYSFHYPLFPGNVDAVCHLPA